MEDKTMIFNVSDLENYMITETLLKVKRNLEEKGYNGINQIVGYLLTGDLTYITNYNEARSKIRQFDRDDLLEELVKNYLGVK